MKVDLVLKSELLSRGLIVVYTGALIEMSFTFYLSSFKNRSSYRGIKQYPRRKQHVRSVRTGFLIPNEFDSIHEEQRIKVVQIKIVLERIRKPLFERENREEISVELL